MNYRAVLEILKLGVPEEVALQFCLTSALWLRAARSGELWWTYCQDRNIGEEYFSSFASPLEAYKSLKAAHFTVSIQYNETLLWYDCENRRFEKKLDVPMGLILEEVRMVLMGDLSVVLLGGGAGGYQDIPKWAYSRTAKDDDSEGKARNNSGEWADICIRRRAQTDRIEFLRSTQFEPNSSPEVGVSGQYALQQG